MDPAILKAVTEYGIAVIGLFFLTRFLVWLIKYILERNKVREETILQLLNNDVRHLCESMTILTSTLTNFTQQVNNAHEYQRSEHKDLADNQSKTNQALITTNMCLNQVEQALNKINEIK